ncbi:MAG: S26 family signal peptidase [Flavobacteriales bacterium]
MEYIILFILIAEYFVFLPAIFEKAGTEKWKGYVPFYNFFVWIKIMKKPWYWILFLIIPGVNFLMLIAMNLELARAFNRFSTQDTLLAIFLPHYIIPKLALDKSIVYVGATDWTVTKQRVIRKQSDQVVLFCMSFGIVNALVFLFKLVGSKDKADRKSIVKEWGDAVLFAIVAASIIRAFFLEAFKIPTPSMEKNLLVGDFLFVSKISYGPKLPQTPIAVPFVHHTLPIVNTKSYLEIFKVPYFRLPGIGKVERNDVVVFNFPAGDSVFLDAQDQTYYSLLELKAFQRFYQYEAHNLEWGKPGTVVKKYYAKRDLYLSMIRTEEIENGNIVVRPVDKEDHYIKRCVALPGDVIYVKDNQLYVNGKPSGNTPKMQFNHKVTMHFQTEQMRDKLKEGFDVNYDDFIKAFANRSRNDSIIEIPVVNERLNDFKAFFKGNYVGVVNHPLGYYQRNPDRCFPIFPNAPNYSWTSDNFACDSLGPLRIPKKGATVNLTLLNLPIYKRIIQVYEKNTLDVKGNDIFINGKETSKYTFKQDYFWLMGDNRQNSADSRFWGFVPEDHIVGKGVFVWFSSDPESGVRWNRIFTAIR